MLRKAANLTYQTGRRIVIAIVGTSILLLGIIMILTPGPAFVVIPLGLAILAVEFLWARRWLEKIREMISRRGAEKRGEQAEEHR
jgi:tellurite resistance protein TerC